MIIWLPMKNLYLFHGEDSYSSFRKSLHWQTEFEKKYGDLNTEILEGGDLTAGGFMEAVNTLPFLSEKRFIIVKNAFSEGDTEELKTIAEKIELIGEHCVVVFIERSKADQRTSLFKALKKHGEIMNFNPPEEYALTAWITAETQKKGGRISTRTAGHLAETVGPNLWQLTQEIEKLTVNANGREITNADVDNLASPNIETTVFILTDNLGLKKRRESLLTLKKLIDSGANLIPTLYTVAGHFRTLIQIKDCLNKNMDQPAIIKKLKKHPFVVNKAIGQCKNFTSQSLEQIYGKMLETDIAMKTGKIKMTTEDQSELRLSLEKLFADFCTKPGI